MNITFICFMFLLILVSVRAGVDSGSAFCSNFLKHLGSIFKSIGKVVICLAIFLGVILGGVIINKKIKADQKQGFDPSKPYKVIEEGPEKLGGWRSTIREMTPDEMKELELKKWQQNLAPWKDKVFRKMTIDDLVKVASDTNTKIVDMEIFGSVTTFYFNGVPCVHPNTRCQVEFIGKEMHSYRNIHPYVIQKK